MSVSITKDSIPPHAGERIELESGWYATARTEFDSDMEAPWDAHDGHGTVSEWRSYKWRDGSRGKRAGERVLCSDGFNARFYDFASAVEIARRDGWGCGNDEHKHATKREEAACAAERDYERMRGWANDQWEWIGVIVTLFDAEGQEVDSGSVWGIESDTDYWRDVAAELVNEIAEGVAL